MPSYVPIQNISGWWMDGTAGDASPNGLSAFLQGLVGNNYTGSVRGWTGDRFGNPGRAALFDSSWVQYNWAAWNSDNVTVSAWVKVDDPMPEQAILSTEDGTTGFYLGVVRGMAKADAFASIGQHYSLTAGQVPSGVWTHVAMTWKTRGAMILYVNGVAVDSVASDWSGLRNDAPDLVIGAKTWGVNMQFPLRGAIHQVGLWSVDLSAQQVAGLYSSEDPVYDMPAYVPASGLIAWYPFTHDGKDESGNGHDARITNGRPCDGTGKEGWSRAYFTGGGYYQPFEYFNCSIDCHIPNLPTGNAPRSFSFWVRNLENPSGLEIRGSGAVLSYGNISSTSTLEVRSGGNDYTDLRYNGDCLVFRILDRIIGNVNSPVGQPGLCFEGDTAYWPMTEYEEWDYHHVAFTFDGVVIRFYFDGKLLGTRQATLHTTLTDLHIAYNGIPDSLPGHDSYTGAIDDIGIWNRALSDAEVMGLFQMGASSDVRQYHPPNSQIKIYPNPAANAITVSGVIGEDEQYSILDVLGKVVQRGRLNAMPATIHLGELPAGEYVFKAENFAIQKFLINRY